MLNIPAQRKTSAAAKKEACPKSAARATSTFSPPHEKTHVYVQTKGKWKWKCRTLTKILWVQHAFQSYIVQPLSPVTHPPSLPPNYDINVRRPPCAAANTELFLLPHCCCTRPHRLLACLLACLPLHCSLQKTRHRKLIALLGTAEKSHFSQHHHASPGTPPPTRGRLHACRLILNARSAYFPSCSTISTTIMIRPPHV